MPVFVLRPLLFLRIGCRTRASSSEYKLTMLILQTGGAPSYHLTSHRKLALIQKPSVQIPQFKYLSSMLSLISIEQLKSQNII